MAEDFRRDATENMYLGDIKARDVDNLKLVHRKIHEHWFDKEKEAMAFMGATLNSALKKLGIDQLALAAQAGRHGQRFLIKTIDKAMRKADVKVERRKYKEEEMWKSGVYIYHHNEIAYFIGEPMQIKGGKSKDSHLIIPSRVTYLVQTNFGGM